MICKLCFALHMYALYKSRKRGKYSTNFLSNTEENVLDMETTLAMTTTLTNRSVAVGNLCSLEGTIPGNVPNEVREIPRADSADSRLSGVLSWDGVASHEDAPEKPNLLAENPL